MANCSINHSIYSTLNSKCAYYSTLLINNRTKSLLIPNSPKKLQIPNCSTNLTLHSQYSAQALLNYF